MASFSRREEQTWDSEVPKHGIFYVRERLRGVVSAPGKGECVDTDDW